MGILRADRVSGLGGANAINGSVFFGTSDLQSNNQNLIVSNTSELNIGSGNFTIEYWFNCGDASTDGFNAAVATTEYTNTSSNTAFNIYHYNKGFRIYNRASSSFPLIFTNDNSWTPSTWHHFAWVREGTGSSENKVYIDGSHIGSAFTNAADYTTGQDWLIGANFYGNGYGQPEYGFSGYLSNVRVSNVARYTVNFTAPTTRYEKDANTIILACQSPGNILKEETGKTLTPCTKDVNTAFPVASHIAPDVGEDHGTTFADNTKFDTLSYMVPPGGTTAQSNRGRGVIVAGENPSKNKSISYLQIQSGGIAKDFGDLTKNCGENKAVGSSTRGVIHLSGDDPNTRNTLEYITFATTSNSIDFGDLNAAWWMRATGGNETRGLFAGGLYPGSTFKNDVDYITIATLGNAQDFGDLQTARNAPTGCASPTRFLVAGGQSGPATSDRLNTIDYFTIATTGNYTNFGDLTAGGKEGCSAASSTRGVFGPRLADPGIVNTIDYVTIASTGNATDFGDGLTARGGSASLSNSIRGAWAGGYTPSKVNSIEFVNIASTSNAFDFGDITYVNQYGGGCSDSHGGI